MLFFILDALQINIVIYVQGGHGDAVQRSTGVQSLKTGAGFANSSRLAAIKGLPGDDGTDEENCMTVTSTEALASKC